MNNFATLFEFGCEMFGYDKAINMNNDYINMFYIDWKENYSMMSIEQYKSLLSGRG